MGNCTKAPQKDNLLVRDIGTQKWVWILRTTGEPHSDLSAKQMIGVKCEPLTVPDDRDMHLN